MSSGSITVVRALDPDRWRRFVAAHPDAQVFHTPEMFDVFERARGHRPTVWAAVDGDGDPQALLVPVEITLLGGPARRFTTRTVVFGGPLWRPGAAGTRALDRLLGAYVNSARRRTLFTELRHATAPADTASVLAAHGFVHEPHLNFLVDLERPTDLLWKAIRSNARRNIRKAEQLGVEVEDVVDPSRVPDAHALLASVYRHIDVPLPDVSLFRAAFDVLHPREMLRIFIAKAGGDDLGALMLLVHGDTALYWYTGVLREHAAYRANDLLVWHALRHAQASGLKRFDFGGAGKPDEPYGVRDFKAKFGGTLIDPGRDVLVHAPRSLQVSEVGYRLLRRFL